GPLVPRLRSSEPAIPLPAPPRRRDGRSRVDVDGAAVRAVYRQGPRRLLRRSGRATRAAQLAGANRAVLHALRVGRRIQQWMYTTPEGRDRDERDRKWLELRWRFEGDTVDWSGLDAERIARWYFQPHFFDHPFYYIEYGIAQLGALQVWRNSLTDQRGAIRKYREALALGATRPPPELYGAAGARLIFDSE